jgi:hypothetical protein
MNCSRVTLVLVPLLALALTAPATRADGPEKTKDVKDQLEEISRKLDRVLDQQADVEKMRDAVRRLDERVRALENLRDEITASARRNTRFSPSVSTSAYPPAAAGTGTIRIRNTSPFRATVILNDRASYEVPALDTITVSAVPAGDLNYRVIANGFGEIRPTPFTSTLKPNETLTIEIYPR